MTLSHGGYAKAQPVSEYRAQGRGGRGKSATAVKDEDFVDKLFVANTHDTLLCFLEPRPALLAQGLPVAAGGPRLARQADRQPAAAGGGRAHHGGAADPRIRRKAASSSWRRRRARSRRRRSSAFSRPRAAGIIAVDLEEGDKLVGVRITDGIARRHAVHDGRQGDPLRRGRRAADGPQCRGRARHPRAGAAKTSSR